MMVRKNISTHAQKKTKKICAAHPVTEIFLWPVRELKQAFGTVAAPDILLAPDVAAAKDLVIAGGAGEITGNLKFRERAKHTEIVDVAMNIFFFVIVKILFKLKTFGVLVVDHASGYGAFIGAGFVGQRDIG